MANGLVDVTWHCWLAHLKTSYQVAIRRFAEALVGRQVGALVIFGAHPCLWIGSKPDLWPDYLRIQQDILREFRCHSIPAYTGMETVLVWLPI